MSLSLYWPCNAKLLSFGTTMRLFSFIYGFIGEIEVKSCCIITLHISSKSYTINMHFSKFINPTFVLLILSVLISSFNITYTLLLLMSSTDKLSVYCLIIDVTKLFSISINLDTIVT